MPFESFMVIRDNDRCYEFQTGMHWHQKVMLLTLNIGMVVLMVLAAIFFPPEGLIVSIIVLALLAFVLDCICLVTNHKYHVIVGKEARLLTVDGHISLQADFNEIEKVECDFDDVYVYLKINQDRIEIYHQVGWSRLNECQRKINRLIKRQ
jgi:hypothetical protein